MPHLSVQFGGRLLLGLGFVSLSGLGLHSDQDSFLFVGPRLRVAGSLESINHFVMNKRLLAKKSQQLENELAIALDKLDQLDTSEVGIRECVKLFSEYSHEDFLKPIVSRIMQVFRNKHSGNLLRENAIIVVGVFAASFKDRAIPYVSQLVRVVTKHFEWPRESLQQSCARSLKEIYQNVLMKCDASTQDSLLFVPLLDCLLTAQSTVQSTCSLSLYELLLFCTTQGLHKDFHRIAGKILSIIGVGSDNPESQDRKRRDRGLADTDP